MCRRATVMGVARDEPPRLETPLDWVMGAGAFAVELWFWAACGVLGWLLGGRSGTALAWLGALLGLALGIVVWAVWISPNGPRRLPFGPRLVATVLLLAGVGIGLALVGHPLAGGLLAVVGSAACLVAAVHFRRQFPGSAPAPRGGRA